jgi:oligopeptide transport system substrate-binding protein
MDESPNTASVWTLINDHAIRRRRFLELVGVVGVTAALAACSSQDKPPGGPTGSGASSDEKIPGPPWSGGQRGGSGVSLWPDTTVTFDPPLAYGQADYYGLSNFYRGLMFYAPGANPQLDIAKSLDISKDGLTYTFSLRDGVKFHNGRTVTAKDFKWTFERSSSKKIDSWVQGFLGSVKGHKEFTAGTAKEITGIVAKDDKTLLLKLTKPDVTILGVLGIPPFYVLPKEEVVRLGSKFAQHPIGSGPYKFKSWNSAQSILKMERNEAYVFADALPYLDEVEYRWNVSADLAYLTVARDQADLTFTLPASAIPRIKKDPRQSKRFKEWGSFTLSWWQFDLTKKPFNDIRVRQAVNYAFNRQATEPYGYIPDGHFYPSGLFGYDKSAPVYQYDPEKAKSLLADAGVTGLSFTLPVFGSGAPDPVAQLLQQNLKDVGITVDIKQVNVNPYDVGENLPKQYRMWRLGWGMGLPDPSELVSSLMGTRAPSNYGGYSNSKIDSLGRAAISETDHTKRAAMYAQIERLYLQDAPCLFLGSNSAPSFISSKLQNFYYEPILRTYWDRYWKTGS